jgi:hypothetical protein
MADDWVVPTLGHCFGHTAPNLQPQFSPPLLLVTRTQRGRMSAPHRSRSSCDRYRLGPRPMARTKWLTCRFPVREITRRASRWAAPPAAPESPPARSRAPRPRRSRGRAPDGTAATAWCSRRHILLGGAVRQDPNPLSSNSPERQANQAAPSGSSPSSSTALMRAMSSGCRRRKSACPCTGARPNFRSSARQSAPRSLGE